MSASLFKKGGAGLFRFWVEIPKLSFWIQSRGAYRLNFRAKFNCTMREQTINSTVYRVRNSFLT